MSRNPRVDVPKQYTFGLKVVPIQVLLGPKHMPFGHMDPENPNHPIPGKWGTGQLRAKES